MASKRVHWWPYYTGGSTVVCGRIIGKVRWHEKRRRVTCRTCKRSARRTRKEAP